MKNKNGESLVSRIFTLRNMAVVFLVVYFAIFLAYPIFKAFAGSLHNWNPLIGTYDWVGLDNFKQILTDKLFWTSMGNTAVFAGVSTLFRIVLGLGLALLLSAKLVKCKDTLRGLFYMPTITPLVAVSFVWMWMFDPQFGMVNKITGLDINWLHDTKWANAGSHHHDHLEGFWLRDRSIFGRSHESSSRRVRGGRHRRCQLSADFLQNHPAVA